MHKFHFSPSSPSPYPSSSHTLTHSHLHRPESPPPRRHASNTQAAQNVDYTESPSNTSTQTSKMSISDISELDTRKSSLEGSKHSTFSPESGVCNASDAERSSNATGADGAFTAQFDEVQRLLVFNRNQNASNTQGSHGQSPDVENETEDVGGHGESDDAALTDVDVKRECTPDDLKSPSMDECTDLDKAGFDSPPPPSDKDKAEVIEEVSVHFGLPVLRPEESCSSARQSPMEDRRAELEAFEEDIRKLGQDIQDVKALYEKAEASVRRLKRTMDIILQRRHMRH